MKSEEWGTRIRDGWLGWCCGVSRGAQEDDGGSRRIQGIGGGEPRWRRMMVVKKQFKATRASRRTTATGLDGTGWEDSIVNGGSQRRTTRRYFRMAPSEGTKGAVGGEPPLPPWQRVCLHAARNRLESKRKETE
ncbi:hypothetical protein ALC62_04998 [Cyphomyrmex costatus]|uniref:Uncharacterized protein n=1 Tax=Cyphomyrmex costatus TaxID=456900 RepID=A0A195CUN4_9HYME|nr:hypothetical protein ALC62_04998 [Cyphomyrmex costatus]